MRVHAVRADGTLVRHSFETFHCLQHRHLGYGVLPGRDEEELVRGRLWLCRLGCKEQAHVRRILDKQP